MEDRMRPHVLLWVALSFLGNPLPAKTVEAAGKRKEGAMSQRVLYSPAPVDAAVRDARPDFLGKRAAGAWFALDDAGALRLLKEGSAVSMLYPSREEYDLALSGLNEAQSEEAIAWRLKVWTPRVKDELMADLFGREQDFLARLARASVKPGAEGDAYKAAYRDDLRLLDHLLYADRYKGWETRILLQTVFEAINELNQDAAGLADKTRDQAAFPSAGRKAERLALATETQMALRKRNPADKSQPSGQVAVAIQRGVYVTPNDPVRVKGIKEGHEPVQVWKGGFVTLWNDWDFASLTGEGKRVEMLYPYAPNLLEDFSRLTEAQRALKFARLQQAQGGQAISDHLAYLQLHLALTLMNVGPLLAKAEPGLSEHIARQAEVESEDLRLALAARPAWGAVREGSEPVQLAAEAERGAAEFAFWRDWAAASRWIDQADAVAKVAAEKAASVASLKRAKP